MSSGAWPHATILRTLHLPTPRPEEHGRGFIRGPALVGTIYRTSWRTASSDVATCGSKAFEFQDSSTFDPGSDVEQFSSAHGSRRAVRPGAQTDLREPGAETEAGRNIRGVEVPIAETRRAPSDEDRRDFSLVTCAPVLRPDDSS
jgi:hypothetical protein